MVLDGSVVAGPILSLVTGEDPIWEREAKGLMSLLPALADPDGDGRRRNWPQTPRAMSGALRRHSPAPRVQGVADEFYKGTNHNLTRMIRIKVSGIAPPQ